MRPNFLGPSAAPNPDVGEDEEWMPVESGAYAMLVHCYGTGGELQNVIPCPILGFVLRPNGVHRALSLRGWVLMSEISVWTPDGCVMAKGGVMFPDLETYVVWAKENVS